MIELQDLEIRYGSTPVLRGVDLSISHGESVALVGESGAGKTTLARVLLGLLTPTEGRYEFDGVDVPSLRGRHLLAWRRAVQAVLQNPTASLNPRVRIDVSVTEPLTARRRMSRGDLRARAGELLENVGLDPALASRYPRQLSGGQQQRVVIARALGAEPRLLLLDEPVSALDVSARAQVLNLLADLRVRTGVTTIYITHDLTTVAYLCGRVVVLYAGTVVEDLPIEKLRSGPDHPYTQELRRAVLDPIAETTVPSRGDAERKKEDGPGTAERQGSGSAVTGAPGCPFATQCPHAQDICRSETPPFVQLDTGWWSRCHFAGDVHRPLPRPSTKDAAPGSQERHSHV